MKFLPALQIVRGVCDRAGTLSQMPDNSVSKNVVCERRSGTPAQAAIGESADQTRPGGGAGGPQSRPRSTSRIRVDGQVLEDVGTASSVCKVWVCVCCVCVCVCVWCVCVCMYKTNYLAGGRTADQY